MAAAVRAGEIPSGYHHWKCEGRAERRLTQLPVSPPEFDEADYLRMNPDVADALRAGGLASGYEHWVRYGRHEGRRGGAAPDADARRRRLTSAGQKPFGVNLYGFQSAVSGLGTAARGYATALQARAIRQYHIAVPRWSGAFPTDDEITHTEPPYRINWIQQNADMVPFFVKKYGADVLGAGYNIGMWVWELAAAHAEWHRASRLLDEIWAPSAFCQRSLATVAAVPVVHMPYAVEPGEAEGGYGRDYFGIPASAFTFLYAFDVASVLERKNPTALVRAFINAFGDSPGALLILKFSNEDADRPGVESLRAIAARSNIRVLSCAYSDAEMASLRRHANCFVSPHRAEGFGLNIAEAMWLAKPVIATGYSGNMDFTSHGNSFVIDYELVNIRRDLGPYQKGMSWADPSLAHLSALLRHVFTHREDARRKGEEAAQFIRRQYSPLNVGRLLEDRFRQIGLHDRVLARGARLAVAAACRRAPELTLRALRLVRHGRR